MVNIKNEVGGMKNNLEKILDEKGIKKSWLAKETGLNKNTITNWINGSIPRLDQAYKTAKILNKNVYDIWPCE